MRLSCPSRKSCLKYSLPLFCLVIFASSCVHHSSSHQKDFILDLKESTTGKPTSDDNDFEFNARLEQPVFLLVHEEFFGPPRHIFGRYVYEGKAMELDRDENLLFTVWRMKQRIRYYVFAAGYEDGTLLYLEDINDSYGTYKSLNVGTEKIDEYLTHLRKIPEKRQFAGWPDQIYYYHFLWKTEDGKQQRLSYFGGESEYCLMTFDDEFQIDMVDLTPEKVPEMTEYAGAMQHKYLEAAWQSSTIRLLTMIGEQP